MSRVLIAGDIHAPCMMQEYPDFLWACYEEWECDRVVFIGDLVDNCSLSFHLKKPHQKDPTIEFEKTMEQVSTLVEYFPEADWLLGNHDVLPLRWCEQVGIPEEYMKSPGEIWRTGDWVVHPRYHDLVIDGVIYRHGDKGKGGRMAAGANARAEFCSVVQGHHHSQAGVEFIANQRDRVFGMQVGCGTDWKHHQQEYGVKYSFKPILGCGVVIDGTTPIFEPMLL